MFHLPQNLPVERGAFSRLAKDGSPAVNDASLGRLGLNQIHQIPVNVVDGNDAITVQIRRQTYS